MIRSMTSFGRSNSEEGKKRVFTVEMKSVNSRYLDVNIRMPKSIISLYPFFAYFSTSWIICSNGTDLSLPLTYGTIQ